MESAKNTLDSAVESTKNTLDSALDSAKKTLESALDSAKNAESIDFFNIFLLILHHDTKRESRIFRADTRQFCLCVGNIVGINATNSATLVVDG